MGGFPFLMQWANGLPPSKFRHMAPNRALAFYILPHGTTLTFSQDGIQYEVLKIFHFVISENWGRRNFGQNATIIRDKLPVTIACGGGSMSMRS